MDSIGLDVAINGDLFELFIKNSFLIKNNLWMSNSVKTKDMAIVGQGLETMIKSEFQMVEVTKVNDDEEEHQLESEWIFDLSKIPLDKHYYSRPGYACFVEHMLMKEVSK